MTKTTCNEKSHPFFKKLASYCGFKNSSDAVLKTRWSMTAPDYDPKKTKTMSQKIKDALGQTTVIKNMLDAEAISKDLGLNWRQRKHVENTIVAIRLPRQYARVRINQGRSKERNAFTDNPDYAFENMAAEHAQCVGHVSAAVLQCSSCCCKRDMLSVHVASALVHVAPGQGQACAAWFVTLDTLFRTGVTLVKMVISNEAVRKCATK
jgi:hypothetical protein